MHDKRCFCVHAYPVKQEKLELMVNIEAANPLQELLQAVGQLTTIANSDGVVDDLRRRSQQNRHLPVRRPAHAHVEVKRPMKRKATNPGHYDPERFAHVSCSSCKELGRDVPQPKVLQATPRTCRRHECHRHGNE
ncbi:hypothetical protein ON010_g3561 [Phytophthora cinnamomi]|nr:hypothetical protein ON010_g3561 [Phytophthora cinnamomi]